jgi:hypothetical protein
MYSIISALELNETHSTKPTPLLSGNRPSKVLRKTVIRRSLLKGFIVYLS